LVFAWLVMFKSATFCVNSEPLNLRRWVRSQLFNVAVCETVLAGLVSERHKVRKVHPL
jgi:hypothetical protein